MEEIRGIPCQCVNAIEKKTYALNLPYLNQSGVSKEESGAVDCSCSDVEVSCSGADTACISIAATTRGSRISFIGASFPVVLPPDKMSIPVFYVVSMKEM